MSLADGTSESGPAVTFNLRFVAHSETGPVRKNNQDSGFASRHLLVVADGMGGAAAGDLASAVAIDTLSRVDGSPDDGAMLEVLADAFSRANERIAALVEDDFSLEGMGTTVTAALFDGSQLGLAHIGDSRAYLLRGGRLERLTHDHSWVQSLLDDGKISTEEAAVHPHRSLLLKVLNGQPSAAPDLELIPVQFGDRLLFCSDGVCGLVDDPDIAAAMQTESLEDALRRLVDQAYAAGGIDNITVILADIVEGDPTGGTFVLGAASERSIPDVLPGSGGGDDDAEDTIVVPDGAAAEGVDEVDDEARYTPLPPAKRRLGRTLAGLLALVLVLGAGVGTGYAWTRTQYYVGVAGEQVAIYQGLPESVPGISLSRVYEVQELRLAALPTFYQDMVRSAIEVDSLDAARSTVTTLQATAERCGTQQPNSPTRPPTPDPSLPTSASPSASVSPGLGPTPGGDTPSTPSVPSPPRTPSTATPEQSC